MTFTKKYTYSVEVCHSELGNIGGGKLSFGGGQQISIQLSITNQLPQSDSELPLGIINAVDEKGRNYTLCNSTVYGTTIYADFLIQGKISDLRFNRVDIRYSDISEWFMRWRRINGKIGETLNWEQLPQEIDASFHQCGRNYNLKTEYIGNIDQIGEDHILHEHIEFCLQSEEGYLSLEDIHKKTRELACLLSILVCHPISLINLSALTDSKKYHQIYFPTFQPVNRSLSDERFLLSCFVQKHALDGQWSNILQNFFNSPHRKIRWTRVAGMQRYNDFWEYKAFGYISLLDSHVTHLASENTNTLTPPPTRKMKALETELKKKALNLEQSAITSTLEAVRKIFSFKSTKDFKKKFQFATKSTNPDIIKIVNLSDDDFKFIKNIRDSIAHGNDIGLEDDEYSRVSEIVGKIELLLTYWAFTDFGLSKDIFLKALTNPFSRLRQASKIDTKHLARVTNAAEFFQVTPEVFQTIADRRGAGVFTCFLEGPNGEIELSDHFMQALTEWRKRRHLGAFTSKQIFGVDDNVVRDVSHMYIECGDESLEFHGAYVFDRLRVTLP